MMSKKANISLTTFGDEDDDTSVATTVNTNEDEEFIAEEDQLRRTDSPISPDFDQILQRYGGRLLIMIVIYPVVMFGLAFYSIDDQNQTWPINLFWILFLFPIFTVLWVCYREYPEETTNCITRCGKGIGFMVCCIPVVVLAALPWILFLNFTTFGSPRDLILVTFAQLVLGSLGKIYFNKHCDQELISANPFACALAYIFVYFFLMINVAFTFFGSFIMLVDLLLDPYGDAIWPIFLSMFLSSLICSVAMLVSGKLAVWTLILVDWAVLKFEGGCCRNGDTAYSRAASQQTNNGIITVEIV